MTSKKKGIEKMISKKKKKTEQQIKSKNGKKAIHLT